jgi:hypothetical protein
MYCQKCKSQNLSLYIWGWECDDCETILIVRTTDGATQIDVGGEQANDRRVEAKRQMMIVYEKS